MTKIWVCSDHHFGHKNILNFKRKDGSPLRSFKDVDEMNRTMVDRHNEVVKPEDHVYFLGDVAITKWSLDWVSKMNGHKRLVRGNHDIFKTKLYWQVGFDEIYGVRVFPKHGLIFSHIPLHPSSISERGWTNVHGHTHYNVIIDQNTGLPDTRYKCVCVEQTDYYPILLME